MNFKEPFTIFTVALLQACLIQNVSAGGFQNSQTSVSALGRGYSGVGIAGDDLSDMFYNPAGLILQENNSFQFGSIIVDSNTEFEDTNSSLSVGNTQLPASGIEDDAGVTSPILLGFYSRKINNRLNFGIGLTTPYGLGTEYEDNWIGRYHSIKSELRTFDINPNIAWQVTDKVAIGMGISAQRASVELSRAIFTGASSPDGKSTLEADDWGFGYNLGALFEISPQTRMGIGLRSSVEHEFSGKLKLELPAQADREIDSNADLELPETAYLSFSHDLGEIQLFSSVRWTNWSRYKELRVKFNNVLPDLVETQKWDDSWTIGLGLNYLANNKWTFRAGYSYDETPVSSTTLRSARSPDEAKHTVSIGARYHLSNKISFDMVYAHTFIDDADINSTTDLVATQPGLASSNLVGKYDADANLFGIQVRWEWDVD